jgi:hypothetical protein
MKKLFLIGVVVSLSATMALAQDRTIRADERQMAQRTRIHQGRESGDITRREAVSLREDQRHIRRSERRAKADGDVSRYERRRLERKQDRASRRIHHARNNPQSN